MIPGDFRLFVGLGNPGSKYTGTRHNIGYLALEKLAARNFINFRENKKLHGHLAEVGVGDKSIRFLMPNTYMNESGRSIRATLDWFDLRVDQLLILVDDMDIPLGRLRLRRQGSSGGHNGLKSIINHLGTQNFCRLRIGIGSPTEIPKERKEMTVKHVLGKFNARETAIVDDVINEVIEGLELIQHHGMESAGNRINSYMPQEN